MDRLKKYCEKYCYDNLSYSNIIYFLYLSLIHNAGELEKECWKYVEKNINSVAKCLSLSFQMPFPYLGSALLIISLQDLLSWTVACSRFCSLMSFSTVALQVGCGLPLPLRFSWMPSVFLTM